MALQGESLGKPADGSTGNSDKKSSNRDYCFRHARMYEGYECPLCASEKAKGGRPPAPGAAGAVQGAGAAGASRGDAEGGAVVVTAESRAASRARSDEAVRLLDAGAVVEAANVADRAIELDRTNLQAYVVGVRAAERTGNFGRQEDLLDDAARLLRDPEYRHVSHWYHDFLRGTRDAPMARPIVAAFIAAGPWPPADSVTMIRALVSRGLAGEALRVIESIPPEHRSLAICGYGAQLTTRAFAITDPDVDAYLARFPAARRDHPLAEFRSMCEESVFPISTLLLIRDALRARYRAWAPEIKDLQEAAARKQAADELQSVTTKPAVSLALRLGGVVLAATIVLTAVGGGMVLFFIGLVLSAGAAIGGFAYGRDAELNRRLPAVLPALLEREAQEESSRWQLVLDDQAPVFAGAAIEEKQEGDDQPAPASPGASAPPASPAPVERRAQEGDEQPT